MTQPLNYPMTVTEAMQPGPELDALVARVMGWEWLACLPVDSPSGPLVRFIARPGINYRTQPATGDEVKASDWDKTLPYFSTDPAAAMEAWTWLEKNHPWRFPWGDRADISLSRGRVYVNQSGPNGTPDCDYTQARKGYNFYFQGNTYPHAVSLAVVEVGRMLGVVDVTNKP